MSYSSRSKVLVALLAGIISLTGVTTSAFGSIHDIPDPVGVSATNPGATNDSSTNWRRGWGNATTVDYLLNLPTPDEEAGEGFIRHVHYRFDRTFSLREVLPGDPRVDMSQVFPSAATAEVKKDLVSHWLQEQPAAWGYTPMSGQRHPWEGRWLLSYRFEADGRVGGASILATPTISIGLGIDVTPPARVRKLVAKPSERYTGVTGQWSESRQAFVFWEDAEYDELSGTAYFEVQVNRETRGSGVFYLPPTRPYVTIHDMPPGKSEIRVRAVDRATNTGPWEYAHFYSDPDEPELAITKPARDGALIGARYTFEVDAIDLAGIRWARFEIDGRNVGMVQAAPYRLTLDMTPYANGAHTLKVTAADMLGREVSKTRTFNLDKVIPTITRVSDSPDPFYPVIQEGYKDWMAVYFTLNKNTRAYLYIYDADGELYATRSALRNAGATSISWDGKGDADGTAKPGTYSYRLKVEDAAGNVTWWGKGSTTIRDFEIVRVGPNAVRIVPR